MGSTYLTFGVSVHSFVELHSRAVLKPPIQCLLYARIIGMQQHSIELSLKDKTAVVDGCQGSVWRVKGLFKCT